jgi:hypothetical protein
MLTDRISDAAFELNLLEEREKKSEGVGESSTLEGSLCHPPATFQVVLSFCSVDIKTK